MNAEDEHDDEVLRQPRRSSTESRVAVSPEECAANCTSFIECVQVCVLQIKPMEVVNSIINWVSLPVILLFLLPCILMAFIYISSFIAYVYKNGVIRRMTRLTIEGDLEAAVRQIIAAMWLVKGQLWFGYEVRGIENIPAKGPALLVYYHGALPIDYYYLVAYITLKMQRDILSVVDLFLFKVPGLSSILKAFNCTPGTVETCAEDLKKGHLLGVSPGGVYEAQFSSHQKYDILWKNRVGFAKISLKAGVPIIPVFTKNVREAFRSVRIGMSLTEKLYNRIRFPCVPIYGGVPVKLTTYLGKPIYPEDNETPESMREKCQLALESMIQNHQRLPGSMLHALLERFPCWSNGKSRVHNS